MTVRSPDAARACGTANSESRIDSKAIARFLKVMTVPSVV
jgi:hypothetical protein